MYAIQPPDGLMKVAARFNSYVQRHDLRILQGPDDLAELLRTPFVEDAFVVFRCNRCEQEFQINVCKGGYQIR